MDDTNILMKDISARVHALCDDIIAGKVTKELLNRHKIPQEYLNVCRDQNHPSCQKMRNRLYEYLMRCIGYYDNIGNAEKIAEIQKSLDNLLYNPQKGIEQTGLYLPRMILGVKDALNKIEVLNSANTVDFAEKKAVNNVIFGKKERSFELGYGRDPRIPVTLERTPSIQTSITIGGEDYVVPAGGLFINGHRVTFSQFDEVTVRFDKLHSANLREDKAYYFRYITEIGTKEDVCMEFEKTYYDVDGQDTYTIDTQANGNQLTLYTYSLNDKRYLVIEYHKKQTARENADFCFAALVALEMITTKVHLNECWLVAYDNADMQTIQGLFFQTLTDSIECSYSIFTSNVFPALVNVAQRIDPINGEHRACDIITNLKLSNALPWFSTDVFGRLVENMVKYEELRRGIFIILMGSRLHLEVQAAIYCVALEAISNLAPAIIGPQKKVIISRKKDWKVTMKRFLALSEDLCQQQVITEAEKKDIGKKINSMNNAFNSEKLRSLLEYYHYPLRQFDELTLFLRNLLLHGNINFDLIKDRKPEDYLFELSINLHKLCCATALLMSGYEGYIMNNRKYYGFASSYKAFIKIGNNVKVDYPKYKEKKVTIWGKVCEVAKRALAWLWPSRVKL